MVWIKNPKHSGVAVMSHSHTEPLPQDCPSCTNLRRKTRSQLPDCREAGMHIPPSEFFLQGPTPVPPPAGSRAQELLEQSSGSALWSCCTHTSNEEAKSTARLPETLSGLRSGAREISRRCSCPATFPGSLLVQLYCVISALSRYSNNLGVGTSLSTVCVCEHHTGPQTLPELCFSSVPTGKSSWIMS